MNEDFFEFLRFISIFPNLLGLLTVFFAIMAIRERDYFHTQQLVLAVVAAVIFGIPPSIYGGYEVLLYLGLVRKLGLSGESWLWLTKLAWFLPACFWTIVFFSYKLTDGFSKIPFRSVGSRSGSVPASSGTCPDCGGSGTIIGGYYLDAEVEPCRRCGGHVQPSRHVVGGYYREKKIIPGRGKA